MTDATFLGGRVMVRQPQTGFRAGLDAVMLAAAVPAQSGQAALELGSGDGTASLCLAARVAGLGITGLEIVPALATLAGENAVANGMEERVRFVQGDVFAAPLKTEFDHVFVNPPFHGPGNPPADAGRATALMDGGRLGAWLEAGLRRTVSGGILTAILRADRLGEALAALPATGVTLFPLWPKQGVAAKRAILRVIKGSGAAFTLHPGLVLHGRDGSYGPEAEAILRRGEALALDFPRL